MTPDELLSQIQVPNGKVDLLDIAAILGVEMHDWQLEEGITSRLTVRQNRVILIIDQKWAQYRPIYRLIAGHALAHVALGHLKDNATIDDCMANYKMPNASAMEQQATLFAIDVLAPQKTASRIISEFQNPIASLAKYCEIPEAVSKFVVKQLARN